MPLGVCGAATGVMEPIPDGIWEVVTRKDEIVGFASLWAAVRSV